MKIMKGMKKKKSDDERVTPLEHFNNPFVLILGKRKIHHEDKLKIMKKRRQQEFFFLPSRFAFFSFSSPFFMVYSF